MLKVFIVDDEKILRQGFLHMVNWQAHDIQIVGEASNGSEALQQIEKILPDVVVTDIRMPVMDGIELTRKIKESFPQIEIIILSSFNDYDYVRETLTQGAFDYILKPRIEGTVMLDLFSKIQHKRSPSKLIQDNRSTAEASSLHSHSSEPDRLLLELDYSCVDAFLQKKDIPKIEEYIISAIMAMAGHEHFHLNAVKKLLGEAYYLILFKLKEKDFHTNSLSVKKFANFNLLESSNSIEELFQHFHSILADIDCHIHERQEKRLHPIIAQVIEYIENHCTEDISLASAASYIHMNKSYLSELFKANTGKTFIDYLTHIRMRKAKEILKNPLHSIAYIASAVGYPNSSYFSKVFKQETGFTPMEFQRNYGI